MASVSPTHAALIGQCTAYQHTENDIPLQNADILNLMATFFMVSQSLVDSKQQEGGRR